MVYIYGFCGSYAEVVFLFCFVFLWVVSGCRTLWGLCRGFCMLFVVVGFFCRGCCRVLRFFFVVVGL